MASTVFRVQNILKLGHFAFNTMAMEPTVLTKDEVFYNLHNFVIFNTKELQFHIIIKIN